MSRNIKLMYATTLISGLMFYLPILALYFEKSLFSAANVAIIFSIEAIAMVIFEIPTGVIADLFGRKNTMIFDYVLTICAIIVLWLGGSMFMFILYAILNAFAWSLSSGAYNAFIYDDLAEHGRASEYQRVIGRMYALWPLGAGVGSLIGGYLAGFSLQLPVILTVIPMLISGIMIFFLKEPSYHRPLHRNIFRQARESLATALKSRQLLLIFLGSFFFWGLAESSHNLGPLFWEFKNIPVTYFGLVGAAIFGFSAPGHLLSYPISQKIGTKYTAVLSVVLLMLLFLISTLLFGPISVLFFALRSVPFGLYNPAAEDIMQNEVPSSQRATIFSIGNLINRIGIAFFAPILGYLADLYDINTAYMLFAFGLLIVPVIFLFLKNTPPLRGGSRSEPKAPACRQAGRPSEFNEAISGT